MQIGMHASDLSFKQESCSYMTAKKLKIWKNQQQEAHYCIIKPFLGAHTIYN
jgi:hypothetical protein